MVEPTETPTTTKVTQKRAIAVGAEHKNPLAFLQKIMIAVFERTGKPVRNITEADVTLEDISNAKKS